MKARFLVPLVIFLLLMGLFWYVLKLMNQQEYNPRDVPSVLIDTKAPEFVLPDLLDPERSVSSADLRGKVWLLNVWGTWCPECWREHDYLIYLSKNENVPIIGIDWRDDADKARQMLQQNGNPFTAVGFDPESRVIMDFGVYGAPETFLIDKQGYIRWKHAGAITPEVWSGDFKPRIMELEKTQ